MKQFNQAKIALKPGANGGQDRIMLNRGTTAEWLNVHSDKPKAKFDLVVRDQWNNEVLRRKVDTGEAKRFGERVSMDLTDTYYDVTVENVEGAEEINIFLD